MNTKLYCKRFDTGATVDVNEDFTLPDYQPEIVRVIGVKACTSIDGKYLSGEELEADGGVTYTVLYMDGEGKIASASQNSSYTGHIALKTEDDLYGANDIVLSANVENVNCRVTAPRRFTLSSKVRLSAVSQKPVDVSIQRTGEEKAGCLLRRKCEQQTTACLTEIRKTGDENGTFSLPAASRIIAAQTEMVIGSTTLSSAGQEANVKGDIYLTLLVEQENGSYSTVKNRIPFEETVPLPEETPDGTRITAFPNVVMLEIEADETGNVTWNTEYDMDCVFMRICEAEITKDAYLTDCTDQLTTTDYAAYCPMNAGNGRLTVTGTAKLRPEMSYLTSYANAVADKCEVVDGCVRISGNIKVTYVSFGNGETVTEEIVLPFRYDCEGGERLPEKTVGTGRTAVSVYDISARCDGDNLNLTVELAISSVNLAMKEVTAVTQIASLDDSDWRTTSPNVIRVYVPDEGENEWDVSKKFRLKTEAKPNGKVYVI